MQYTIDIVIFDGDFTFKGVLAMQKKNNFYNAIFLRSRIQTLGTNMIQTNLT